MNQSTYQRAVLFPGNLATCVRLCGLPAHSYVIHPFVGHTDEIGNATIALASGSLTSATRFHLLVPDSAFHVLLQGSVSGADS